MSLPEAEQLTTFAELPVGSVFYFANQPGQPWRKIDSKRYSICVERYPNRRGRVIKAICLKPTKTKVWSTKEPNAVL